MSQLIIYTTQWCGDCRKAKRYLDEQKIAYTEIDIEETKGAAEQIIEWSGGRRVIPTFVIHRSEENKPLVLHNPPLGILAQELGL